MSIRINNKIISGTYTAQSYRYVGEIFQSALPIEDSRVALLDGHKIYESEGYGSFIQYITSLALLYPQLSCTEDEWQLSDTTYGECGKFVISEDGVRLPKIVSFVQGLSSLQDLATLVEAGLPNITGNTGNIVGYLNQNGSGAMSGRTNTASANLSSGSLVTSANIPFDASLSNPIYGNSTTVQPQSIRYPYYIVLATGVTQEVKVKEELTTNIPFTLFESKYSEVELNNTSWLLSSGQWNSKELYPTAYNELVKEYNAGSNKYSIKLHTEEYGDYDFVLNLNNETFRLPLKTKFSPVRENSSVVGNGNSLGLTNGTNFGCVTVGANSGAVLLKSDTIQIAGTTNTTSGRTYSSNYQSMGITTDPTKSGIELYNDISDLYLYFYVGDTNINVSLVDTGKLTQEVANLIPNNSSLISGYSMPSDKYVDLELGASGTTYTAPANGWVVFIKNSTNVTHWAELSSNGVYTKYQGDGYAEISIPVRKGATFRTNYIVTGDTIRFQFIYAEGEI